MDRLILALLALDLDQSFIPHVHDRFSIGGVTPRRRSDN